MQISLPGQLLSIQDIIRDDLAQDAATLMIREINPRLAVVWDSGALLPAAGTSDDLGFYPGTFGTHFPYIGSGDVKGATTQRKCRFTFALPPEYVPSGAIIIRAKSGMVTTVAGTSAFIDFSAYKADGAIKTGSDLVTTGQTSINSLTWANVDFGVDGSGLVAGDELDVLCTIDVIDAVNATAVIAAFRPFFGCTSRG